MGVASLRVTRSDAKNETLMDDMDLFVYMLFRT